MNLESEISGHFRLSEFQKKALKKLGLVTVRDLLYHFPARYEDLGASRRISELRKGEKAVVYGKLSSLKALKAWRKKIPMAEGKITDDTGTLKIVWFNQPYIAKMYEGESVVRLEGKVAEREGELYLSNPNIERAGAIPRGLFTGGEIRDISLPVYSESRGVTSRFIYFAIQKLFSSGILETLEDPLPEEVRKRYNLPDLTTALIWIHTPKNLKNSAAARKRFAFEEVFMIQLRKQQERSRAEKEPSWIIDVTKKDLDGFISRFPFDPTYAQTRALNEIIRDVKTPHAMSRLLEGDVGSGKTFVAAASAYSVVTTAPKNKDGKRQNFGNLQVAYMAPTEILAKQHFESFIEFFRGLPIQIGLITSSGCRKFPSKVSPNTWTDISRPQLLKWVANGEIPILIGTHALIQKKVTFKHLAYVIIDEQHRFGTNQRALLARKDRDVELPHLLSMTATPIPRTLALTIFGDLDLTLLDEMPPGRKEVITEVVPKEKREAVYEKIRQEIRDGRQAYVICPRIEEPDETKANALRVKSVKEEALRLQTHVFPKLRVRELHGKMLPKEKDRVMKEFSEGNSDVLVATSVIEVGVNVPNATMIIIEGAERFGLAQLHQLRGRVLRSTHQAYCFVFPDTKSALSLKRLRMLEKARNGFELAEYDLELRGAGELYGGKQWGISDIGMEAIRNFKMVEAARAEAQKLVLKDVELSKYPLLIDALKGRGEVHFE